MFKFLKGKLKKVVGSFSKKAEEEIAEEELFETKGPEEAGPEEFLEKHEEPSPETGDSETVEKPPKAGQDYEKPEPRGQETADLKGPAQPESSDLRSTIEQVRSDLKRKGEEIREDDSKGFFARIKGAVKKREEPEPEEDIREEKEVLLEKPEAAPEPEAAEEVKKGFLKRVTRAISTKRVSEKKFEEMFEDLEIALLENNVALEVIDKIKRDLKASVVGVPLRIGGVESLVVSSLKQSIDGLFSQEKIDIVQSARLKKPYVVMFVGINGSGKTTTIAKVANLLKESDLRVVMAAADTFRAAAIHQLQEHADRLSIKLVKHDYGSDPAAVAFDAIKYAESKKADIVLVDTAGRQHNNKNLMEEVKKIVRVAKPDLKIFIGESITGNDCVEQAQNFESAVGIDGIILTKADVDEKGGAAISISYVTKKPIIYLGTGQEYSDLKRFNPSVITDSLGLSA